MIFFFTFISIFIAAWMYFIGAFDREPKIVRGGYALEKSRRKIIAAYGVPPLLIGRHVENRKKETLEERDRFYKERIAPLMKELLDDS